MKAVTDLGAQFESGTEVQKDEALNWLLAISQFMYGLLNYIMHFRIRNARRGLAVQTSNFSQHLSLARGGLTPLIPIKGLSSLPGVGKGKQVVAPFVRKVFRTGSPADYLFSSPRKGNSRIRGSCNFGFDCEGCSRDFTSRSTRNASFI
jgi:hypothetical protein